MKAQPEYQLQKALAEYLRKGYPSVLFLSDVRASLRLTIPQQLRAKAIQADNFACPDMVIFEARGDWHGMFMELKADSPYKKNGDLKKDSHLERQADALIALQEKGYHADWYWTFDEARKQIDWYLK